MIHVVVMQGCRQGGAGGLKPPKFKLMLLCVQAVTAKECPKCRKQERLSDNVDKGQWTTTMRTEIDISG